MTKPGAITARALTGTVTVLPGEGARLRFGRNHPPQSLARQQVADQLKELQPDEVWDVKRVDRVVLRVRQTLTKRGVRDLTRDEVGEPVGNSLNHNLLTELAVTTGTLKRADLALLGDIE